MHLASYIELEIVGKNTTSIGVRLEILFINNKFEFSKDEVYDGCWLNVTVVL